MNKKNLDRRIRKGLWLLFKWEICFMEKLRNVFRWDENGFQNSGCLLSYVCLNSFTLQFNLHFKSIYRITFSLLSNFHFKSFPISKKKYSITFPNKLHFMFSGRAIPTWISSHSRGVQRMSWALRKFSQRPR